MPGNIGGRSPKDKENREERLLVRYLQQHGFGAEKIPLSGACGGRFGSDVSMPLLGVDRKIEVEVRKHGFETIYRWLAGADMLVVRKNHKNALVIVPLKLAVEVAAAAEAKKS